MHQEWAGKFAGIRLGRGPGVGWDQAGKCLVWGGSVLAFIWELYLDQAGKGIGNGPGSSSELG